LRAADLRAGRNNIKAGRNESQGRRNENQARRNENQARRNENQIMFSFRGLSLFKGLRPAFRVSAPSERASPYRAAGSIDRDAPTACGASPKLIALFLFLVN
jgi:hypothetical protein